MHARLTGSPTQLSNRPPGGGTGSGSNRERTASETMDLAESIKPQLRDAERKLEKLNPDQFEIYVQRKTSTRIEAKDQKIDSLGRAEDIGMAIRVIKDRRPGFSFTTSLEKSAIERAIDSALEVAAQMPEDALAGLATFGSYVYPAVDNWDAQGLKVPVARKSELAKELESLCRKADPRIKGLRSAAFSETAWETLLVDSQGERIHHQSTTYSASVTCKAEAGGESQIGSDFFFSNYLDNLDIRCVAERAAQRATELLGAGRAPTMVCPAVLRNRIVADLVDFLSSSFSAEEIAKGRSMLADQSGQHVFSDQMTLTDDGLLPGGLGTAPFDGEGVPSGRTVLVDGGFVSGTLTDGYHSRKLGLRLTGNAARGIQRPPGISTTNLFMSAGRKAPEALLDGIQRGVLLTDLLGLHTANPVTGDFSLGASGILIENGKLTRPVRGFAVAGNVLELFRKMTDVASDLRFFGSTGAPSARVSEVSIGGE